MISQQKPFFGAHMPTSGGAANGIISGHKIRCDAVQIFTSSPRQWKSSALTDDAINAFKRACSECAIAVTISHDSYLINLAAPPESEILAKSHAAFREEILRAEALNLNYIVSHPGAHGGDGDDVGIARLVKSLDKIHDETAGAKVVVALETTAGQGTYLGGRFEHLERILSSVKAPERIGVCLDTCHIFAAGYDVRDRTAYEETMELFSDIIGMQMLKVVHANDSKGKFGSRTDRHAHIGEGEIGMEAFHLLVNDPRLAGIPIIVETPESETMHEVNVAKLRGFHGASLSTFLNNDAAPV